MTHYDCLGVPRGASTDEVRRAYLRLARQHHPDLETDPERRRNAERRMQDVNEAWAVLGDRARRAAYDRALGLDSAPKREWQPLHPDDPDEVDPRDLLDDTPIGDGNRLPRALQLAPPLLLVGGILGFVIGSFTAIPGVSALGIVAVILAVVLFMTAPLLAVFRSSRSER